MTPIIRIWFEGHVVFYKQIKSYHKWVLHQQFYANKYISLSTIVHLWSYIKNSSEIKYYVPLPLSYFGWLLPSPFPWPSPLLLFLPLSPSSPPLLPLILFRMRYPSSPSLFCSFLHDFGVVACQFSYFRHVDLFLIMFILSFTCFLIKMLKS